MKFLYRTLINNIYHDNLGSIPTRLTEIKTLKFLDFSNNKFEGKLYKLYKL